MASNPSESFADWSHTSTSGDNQRRHSKEDVLTEREFELLYEATYSIKERFRLEARFCLLCAAKLGLRAGEIAHVSSGWINYTTKNIDIPEFDECTKGTDGDVCGYCRGRARDRVETNNVTVEAAKHLIDEDFDATFDDEQLTEMAHQHVEENNITFEDALDERWNPKTPNSARSIPFDFDTRTELCVERFDEHYETFPSSKATVNRRINRLVENSPVDSRVYPHALRATAASFHASRDVSAYSLMSIMGWDNLETARSYINASDETAAKEIRSKHR